MLLTPVRVLMAPDGSEEFRQQHRWHTGNPTGATNSDSPRSLCQPSEVITGIAETLDRPTRSSHAFLLPAARLHSQAPAAHRRWRGADLDNRPALRLPVMVPVPDGRSIWANSSAHSNP